MAHLRHIRKYFFKYRYHLLLGIAITIVSRIFSLFMPRYVKNSIAAIEQYARAEVKDPSQITWLLIEYAAIIIGTTIVSAVLMFFMRQLIINVSRYIEYDLKNEIFVKYEQLSMSFYKRNRVGDLMNRISEDVSKVRMYAGPAIMYSVQTITLFVCVIPLMFIISPTLTAYTLIPLPILSVLIYKMSARINTETMRVQAYLSDLTVFSQETFSGIGIIKAYNDEDRTDRQLAALADEEYEARQDTSLLHPHNDIDDRPQPHLRHLHRRTALLPRQDREHRGNSRVQHLCDDAHLACGYRRLGKLHSTTSRSLTKAHQRVLSRRA